MPEAQITVQYVNPPKAGKKWGSIKADDGQLYWGPPAFLKFYQPGEGCLIEYGLSGNDGTLRTIKRKISSTPPALAKPLPQGPRQRTNPTDAEQIFVVALLKEIITPDMGPIDLVAKIDELRRVYRNTFGSSEHNRDDEMNDQIPEH